MKDLDDIWIEDDHQYRLMRTARHESGHAAAAWILSDAVNAAFPPFDYIEVGTLAKHVGGVVPGAVNFDPKWFSTLSALEQGAVLLAGVYVQDFEHTYSPQEWRDVLDSLEGGNGVDDYAQVINLADQLEQPCSDFDENIRALLASFEEELLTRARFIASQLTLGHRTQASALVTAWRAWRTPKLTQSRDST